VSRATSEHVHTLVVGGGLIGAAVGLGLVERGERCCIVEGSDDALRAARGNFGLVWVQSKGVGYRPYAALSRHASTLWPEFAARLHALTGVDVGLRSAGGLTFCTSEADFEARSSFMRQQFEGDLPCAGAYTMLERRELEALVPAIGPDVVGASLCHLDGDVNPLRLYRALLSGFQKLGGRYVPGQRVTTIEPAAEGFVLRSAARSWRCDKLVLAAGLGNAALGQQVGLPTPVFPLRGQIMVTEKQPSWLKLPTHVIRQTDEGGILIGDSKEDTGVDDGTALGVMGDIAARALRIFPQLAQTRVIRAWGGLRVMTPGGTPLYQQSRAHPGAYTLNVHSGVTLAPVHAGIVAQSIQQASWHRRLLPFVKEVTDEI